MAPIDPLAFDGGDNGRSLAAGLAVDQRAQRRYKDGYADGLVLADIGAYEADADEFFGSL